MVDKVHGILLLVIQTESLAVRTLHTAVNTSFHSYHFLLCPVVPAAGYIKSQAYVPLTMSR